MTALKRAPFTFHEARSKSKLWCWMSGPCLGSSMYHFFMSAMKRPQLTPVAPHAGRRSHLFWSTWYFAASKPAVKIVALVSMSNMG